MKKTFTSPENQESQKTVTGKIASFFASPRLGSWVFPALLALSALLLSIGCYITGADVSRMQHQRHFVKSPIAIKFLLAVVLVQMLLLPVAGLIWEAIESIIEERKFKSTLLAIGAMAVNSVAALVFCLILQPWLIDGFTDGDWVRVYFGGK